MAQPRPQLREELDQRGGVARSGDHAHLDWGSSSGRRPWSRQAHLCLVRRRHRLPVGLQEWAQRQGNDQRWRHWWYNDDSRHVYFIGKDNIPFHCLFWPAQLMGYDPRSTCPTTCPPTSTSPSRAARPRRRAGRSHHQEGLDLFQADGFATPSPPASPSRRTPTSRSRRSPGGSTKSSWRRGATSSTVCCRWSTRTSVSSRRLRADGSRPRRAHRRRRVADDCQQPA